MDNNALSPHDADPFSASSRAEDAPFNSPNGVGVQQPVPGMPSQRYCEYRSIAQDPKLDLRGGENSTPSK